MMPDKTKFTVKGIFETRYHPNLYVVDVMKARVFRKKEFHTLTYSGRLWIDNVEIFPKDAQALRDFGKYPFTWGNRSDTAHITSIAACLHIFKDERVALNLYPVFTDTFVKNWPAQSFETTMDICDFLIDNRHRLQPDLYSHCYRYGSINFMHEIELRRNSITNTWSIRLAEQVASHFATIAHCKTAEQIAQLEALFRRVYRRLLGPDAVLVSRSRRKIVQKADKIITAYYSGIYSPQEHYMRQKAAAHIADALLLSLPIDS